MRLRAREIAAEGRYEEKHTQPPEAHVSPLCEAKIGLCGFRVFPTEVAFRVVARIRSWILRHHGVIRPPHHGLFSYCAQIRPGSASNRLQINLKLV